MKKVIAVILMITLLFIGAPAVMAADNTTDAPETGAAEAGAAEADAAAGTGLSTATMVTLGVVAAAVTGVALSAGSSDGDDGGHAGH